MTRTKFGSNKQASKNVTTTHNTFNDNDAQSVSSALLYDITLETTL